MVEKPNAAKAYDYCPATPGLKNIALRTAIAKPSSAHPEVHGVSPSRQVCQPSYASFIRIVVIAGYGGYRLWLDIVHLGLPAIGTSAACCKVLCSMAS